MKWIAALVLLIPGTAHASSQERVFYYDTAGAGEFADAVERGAGHWNARVTTVRLRPWQAGRPHDITVTAGDGWPHASPMGFGHGDVSIGRQAVREGHDSTRIAAHELGHILGLPDRRTGRCADLMSGSSAGPSCTNAYPNAHEASAVDTISSRSSH